MAGLVPAISVLRPDANVDARRIDQPGAANRPATTAGRGRVSKWLDGKLTSGTQRGEAVRDHLFQDAPLDRLVGRGRIAPEPAVALHRLGGSHEALGHR